MDRGVIGERFEALKLRLEQPQNLKRLTYATLALWSAGILAADIKIINDECIVSSSSCEDEPADAATKLAFISDAPLLEQETFKPDYADGELAAPIFETTPNTTTPPKRPALDLGLELDPEVEASISDMELSREGYEQFLSNIDTSHLAFAQTFKEFNPQLLADEIHQGPSEIFVLHFTVDYSNPDEFPLEHKHTPVGDFNVRRLIKGMAAQYGHGGKCCGVNWMIGRAARTFQTAPLNAKLNHNPPYNEIITGVEIEAGSQAAITTNQYESAAYLAIAVLDTQGLLGNHALVDILKGHGEMRDPIIDEWNASRPPEYHLGVRDDFDYEESELFRHFVQKFLDENPDIIGSRPLANYA